jgi:hypothetical protein
MLAVAEFCTAHQLVLCQNHTAAFVCCRGNPFVMMMVLEAHKQQQQQEQDGERQRPGTPTAASTTAAVGARHSSDTHTAAEARQHGVQHTTVNRFFAAADEPHAAQQAAAGLVGRRSMEDAAGSHGGASAIARGVQRSSCGSLDDSHSYRPSR